MLKQFQGMFSFVIWDKHTKEAFAARDSMELNHYT